MTDHLTMPYADFVAALVKDGDQIKAEMTGPQAHLLHMAIGVAGEAGELLEALTTTGSFDEENIKEELGDLEFFAEGVRAALGIMREQTLPEASVAESVPRLVGYSVNTLVVAGTSLLDAVKKNVIYQKTIDMAEVTKQLTGLETAMEWIRRWGKVDRETVLMHNRVKLKVRYDKLTFSNEAAQARADKA